MADEIKTIDAAEFREAGFLQEANRQFFHPLGLALEITHVDGHDSTEPNVRTARDALVGLAAREGWEFPSEGAVMRCALAVIHALYPKGSEYLSGVWDYRDDPEGMVFGEPCDPEKAAAVRRLRSDHYAERVRLFCMPGPITDILVEGYAAHGLPPGFAEAPDVQPVEWPYAEVADGDDGERSPRDQGPAG